MQMPKFSQRVQSAAAYGGAVCLALWIAWSVLRLHHASLAVPFIYVGDGLWTASWVKGLIDNHWFLHNHFLGVPGDMDFSDFPMSDNLHFALLKLLCLCTHRFGVALNLYYLGSYLLITLTALYVLRRFVGPGLPSLVPALLYAFLPYHLMRSEGHLFLTSYYMVPLAIMVILWIYPGDGLSGNRADANHPPRFRGRKLIAALVICVLVGSAGVYYAFFTCFFLLVAGLCAGRVGRSVIPPLLAGFLVSVVGASVIGNLTPYLLDRARHGPNPRAVQRELVYSEMFALKITQLLLPLTEHRVQALADLKRLYSSKAPLINENDSVTLGFAGGLALLGLLGVPFWRIGGDRVSRQLEAWSLLTWAALLLGTVGGLGMLFNLLVAQQIRCYNRIVVFIAFFCMLALAAALKRIGDWCGRDARLRLVCAGAMLALLYAGIMDQTSRYWAPRHRELKEAFRQDAQFVQSVEESVPAHTKVFQLPYMPFPEAEFLPYQMQHYDPFRLYLHSRTLRWSYGAMKGRAGDEWQAKVAALAAPQMTAALADAGFGGICIDRAGYADGGRALEVELSRLLGGTTPIVHPAGRWAFFNMNGYEKPEPAQRQVRNDAAAKPLVRSGTSSSGTN